MAALWNLPAIFICENNVYSGAQRMEDHTKVKDIATRAIGYDMPGVVVDGNDAVAVYNATVEARERCLAGEGPTLIECKTYRWRGHGESDHQVYQPKDEIACWMERCPVEKLQKELLDEGFITRQEVLELENEINKAVEESVRFAEDSPWPAPEDALEDIYA